MTFNYNDADDDRLIPNGMYQLKISIKRGGHGSDNMLRLANNLRSLMLECTYTVIGGEHANYKIWDYITVAFDETDSPEFPLESNRLEDYRASVRMGRKRVKAILNSAFGLNPDDKSEAAQAKRNIDNHGALTGLVFWGEINTKPAANGFGPRNVLVRVIVPGDGDYPQKKEKEKARAVVPVEPDDMEDSIPFNVGDEG
jgi:hypothetical protein